LYSVTLADTQDITSIAFSPSGQNLIVERYDPKDFHRAIQILDARTGKSVYDFPDGISSALYSPDGQTLAVVNATLLQVLNSANKQVLYTLNDSNAYIQDVDFSPDGRILVTSRKDENIKFWDAANGQLIREISEKSEHFAFHPNGHQFAVAMEDGFELREIETDTTLWKATSEYVTSVLFSLDGQKVFSRGGDGVVKMWNSDNGQYLSTFNSWELGIVSLSIHPEGHLLATGSYDGRVCLWELPR
jgi:WD40 repeat protein